MTRSPSPPLNEVLSRMQTVFSDLPIYGEIKPRLEQAIIFLQANPINFDGVETLARKYYSRSEIKLLGSQLWQNIQWIFATCSVFMFSFEDRAKAEVWESTNTLTAKYPTFTLDCDASELKLLLDFRNTVRVAMLILKPYRKKEQFLFIAGRLSGIKEKYITGSGESAAVTRRVAIYRRETGVAKEDRSDRVNCTESGQKRKASFVEVAAVAPLAIQTTPFQATTRRNFSISATRKPVTTPCDNLESDRQLAVDARAMPLWPVTPEGHLPQPGTVFFPSEPSTPAKIRRSSSGNSHFMLSSSDWPQFLPLGASQNEPPASPSDDWAEVHVVTFQPTVTESPAVVSGEFDGKEYDALYKTSMLSAVLSDNWFDQNVQ